MKNKISITLNNKILRDVDSTIDNIIIRNRSQAIEYLIKGAFKENKIAVILAGENQKSNEKKIKQRYSVKINHLTLIERTIKKLTNSGFKNIYIVGTNSTLTNIFKIVGNGSVFNSKIEFVNEESEEGTAAALKLLKGKINTTFLVVWCDVAIDNLNLNKLWQQHIQEKVTVTLLISSSITQSDKNTGKWSYVKIEGNKILSYIEKPLLKNLDSSIFFGGVFVAEPELFSYKGRSLEREIFPELAKKGFLGGHLSGTEYLHVHTRGDLLKIRSIIKLN